jgi:hypothetical protein
MQNCDIIYAKFSLYILRNYAVSSLQEQNKNIKIVEKVAM